MTNKLRHFLFQGESLVMSRVILLVEIAVAAAISYSRAHAPCGAGESPVESDAGVSGVFLHTVDIDALDVFYRESAPEDAPAFLLPEGFPISSQVSYPWHARGMQHQPGQVILRSTPLRPPADSHVGSADSDVDLFLSQGE